MKIIGMRWGEDFGGMACGPVGGSTYAELALTNDKKLYFILASQYCEFEKIQIATHSLFDQVIYAMSSNGDIYSPYDITNGKIKIVGKPAISGFQSLLKIDDKVFLIPLDNDGIRVLDNSGNEMTFIPCGNNYYFGGVVEDFIWFFPFDTNRDVIGFCLNDDKYDLVIKKLSLSKDNGKWLNLRLLPSDDDEKWVVSSFGELFRINRHFDILERYTLTLSKAEERYIIEKKSKSGELLKAFSNVVIEGVGLASLNSFIYSVTDEWV